MVVANDCVVEYVEIIDDPVVDVSVAVVVLGNTVVVDVLKMVDTGVTDETVVV